jgi:hypothetical protein
MKIELNLRAKAHFEMFQKRQRTNEMRKWRKQEYMNFLSENSYKDWLDYTGWHDRPMKVTKTFGTYHVQFLDYKPPVKKEPVLFVMEDDMEFNA